MDAGDGVEPSSMLAYETRVNPLEPAINFGSASGNRTQLASD